MMKFFSIFSLFFMLGCQKPSHRTSDCDLLGKAYETSLLKSDLLPRSWKEMKNKHQAFVTVLGKDLDQKHNSLLNNNFLLSFKTLVSLSCGIKPEDSKVVQKEVLQDGKMSKIIYLVHEYYHCMASVWKEEGGNLFFKACKKS